MAIQHIRAFRARREEFGDQINQDIAHAIADAMGNDDSPATVSIKTLAEEARCHYNTADKRTKEMETAGLIKIEKNGRYLTYRIVGEFEPTPYKQPAADNRITEIEKRLDNLERQVEQCVKVIEQLSHDLHTTFTSPSHELHMNFTPVQNGNVNKEVKKVRSEEEENPPNPPQVDFQEPFKPKYSRLIPPALQSNQFLSIWAAYEEYHAGSPKPMTEFTAKRQLKKMAGWGIEKAIEAMNYSMDNNYTGLIEPKASKNGRTPAEPDPYFADIKPVGGLY